MAENEKELEDLEPENGDEVKGGGVLDEARRVNRAVRGRLADEGVEPKIPNL